MPSNAPRPQPIGRGSTLRPANRFESTRLETVPEWWDEIPDEDSPRRVSTQFLMDDSKTILRENNSPDTPFRFAINPYRGCEHGCSYCYARHYHETLGMDAGLDFETKILVKHDAAPLLRKELQRPQWKGELISISGVTDCYQPAERRFRITRGLLEVLLEFRQVASIITKNSLVLRDLDLLAPLAEQRLIQVNISLTTLDGELSRIMEPRTASPQARLRAIRELTQAGVPVRAMTAPIIPGLTDHELPQLLQAAAEAGAQHAWYTLLRLPLTVEPVFFDWLEQHRPEAYQRVEGLLRSTREGKVHSSDFAHRMQGAGPYAESVKQTFKVFAKQCGLDKELPPLDTSRFRVPGKPKQLMLFS